MYLFLCAWAPGKIKVYGGGRCPGCHRLDKELAVAELGSLQVWHLPASLGFAAQSEAAFPRSETQRLCLDQTLCLQHMYSLDDQASQRHTHLQHL